MSRALAVIVIAVITITGALAGRWLTLWLRRREQITDGSPLPGGEMPGTTPADSPAASRAPERATDEATGARDVTHIPTLSPREVDRLFEAVWTLPVVGPPIRCVYVPDEPHAASRMTYAGPMCASHAAWYMTDAPHRTVRS